VYAITKLIRYLLTMAGSVAIAAFAVPVIADQTRPSGTAEIPTEYAIDDPPGIGPLPASPRQELTLAVAELGFANLTYRKSNSDFLSNCHGPAI